MKDRKTKKSLIFRYGYLGFTILVIVLIGFLDPNFEGLVKSFSSFNLKWFSAAVVALLLFWITDALTLTDVCSYLHGKALRPLKALKIAIIGLYYGALTPSATGGQPMQVVYMRREGVPTGTGTGIVCVRFVIYELSLCFCFLIAVILHGTEYFESSPGTFWLTMLGFAINLLLVVGTVLTMFHSGFVLRFGKNMIRFLTKIKFIRHPERAEQKYTATIGDFSLAMGLIVRNKLRVFVSFLYSVINLILLFSIPYLTYRILGCSGGNVLEMMSIQVFLYLAVLLIPTPGSTGASEAGFYLFYSGIFPSNQIFTGLLLWRFFSYYAVIFTGCVMVISDEVSQVRKAKRERLCEQNKEVQ